MSPDAHLTLSEGQEHDVSEWEQAAAAVLRKARRLSDDDQDDSRLGSTHAYDARRHRHQPARHPRPRRRPARAGAPARQGRRLGRPRPARRPRRPCLARRRPHRPRERRPLAVDPGRRLGRRCRRPRHRARRCAPRRRAGRARRPLRPPRRGPRVCRARPRDDEGTNLAAGTNLGVDPVGASAAWGGFDRLNQRRLDSDWSRRLRSWPAGSAAGRWSWTGPRCTTSVPPTSRSSATCSRWGRTTCARSRPPGWPSTTRPGSSSSVSPRPTSSSSASPSCAPCAGSGRGCSSSAAPPRTTARRWSTP